MSLKAVHAGMVWTAIVLIVAVLAYYFIYEYPYRHRTPRYYQRPQPMSRPSQPRWQYQPRPRYNPYPRMPQYKDNHITDIIMVICCLVLPIPIVDFSIDVGVALLGGLGPAGIFKAAIDFICVAVVVVCSFYLLHRRHRIGAYLLWAYSAFLTCYGLYVVYNIIMLYSDLTKLEHL